MRLLILSERHPRRFGSMEEFEAVLSEKIHRQGGCCYLGYLGEPDARTRAELKNSHAVIVPELFHGKRAGLRDIMALLRFIRVNRIDLVHIHFYSLTNTYLLGCYFSGAKIVFTEHTSGDAPVRGRLASLLSKIRHYPLLRRISRYFAITDFVNRRLGVSHHVPATQRKTIYNGVSRLRFVPRDKSAARAQLTLPISNPVFATVAALIPEKGLRFLVEAVAILKRDFALDPILLIAGEGPERGSLESLCRDLGIADQVRFLGSRSDVETVIAAADITVVPSVWHEGFGLIIAESMAAGRPVVASSIGGIPELIVDGETGFLTAPGDARDIAVKVACLLRDEALAARLAENALERSGKLFDLDHNVEKYLADYRDVLADENA